MCRNNRQLFDIFDKRDVWFRDFHGMMESVFQSLHNEGVGAEIKQAHVFMHALSMSMPVYILAVIYIL